jgi:hypothetical protein
MSFGLHSLRSRVTAALLLSSTLMLGACGTGPQASTGSYGASAATAPLTKSEALQTLAKLPIKGRAPKTGYSRSQFGAGWDSVSGCTTRERILTRDLTEIVRDSDDCKVLSGVLNDPYTATRIVFKRGSSLIDIDHVVALGDAWQKGAQGISKTQRVALANDPLNLLAVQASANRSKGDSDAATWLPSNKAYRCNYVSRQVAVKAKYRLWVSSGEAAAIKKTLSNCAGADLPTPSTPATDTTAPASPATPTTAPEAPATPSTPANNAGTKYRNCAEAKAAGAAPLRKGTADYEANAGLDRDKDGVACE